MKKKSIILFFVWIIISGWILGKVNLSNSSATSSGPQMAVDGLGNVHVVWNEMRGGTRGDIFYRMFNGESWSSITNISNNNAVRIEYRNIAIDCDQNNKVYLFWNESSHVRLRTKSGNNWGSTVTISNPSEAVETVRCSVLNDQFMAVSWWGSVMGVNARVYSSGSWESTRKVNRGSARAKESDICMGANDVYCVWVRRDGDGSYDAKYSRRSKNKNSGWSTEADVYNDGHSHSFPRIDITDDKGVYVTFFSYYSGPKINKSVRRINGRFQQLEEINNLAYLHFPALYSQGNRIIACWQEGAYDNGLGLYYAIKYSGASWSKVSYVPDSRGVKSGDVGASPTSDNIYFVWDDHGEIYFVSVGGSGDPVAPPPPPNKPPTANFSRTPAEGFYPLEVYCDASNSHDKDGKIVSYKWDFGDGKKGSGKTITHTFTKEGDFTISLTVEDDDGDAGGAERPVTVIGLRPPLNLKYVKHENRNLFSVEYLYQVTWNLNTWNEKYGNYIVKYKLYRKERGQNSYAYLSSVAAPRGNVEFEYIDRTLGSEDKDFMYAVKGVDVSGRESQLTEIGPRLLLDSNSNNSYQTIE